MNQQLKDLFSQSLKRLYKLEDDIELSIPEEQFGDYSTNIALQLGKQLELPPRTVAEAIVSDLRAQNEALVSEISIAGPGFINVRLSIMGLLDLVRQQPLQSLSTQVVVAEYSDPNPFKVLHAGHLYTSIVGDTIANLMAQAGATVHRVNFGGDVGLHVAKNMWAILKLLTGQENVKDQLQTIEPTSRSLWLSARYVEGNTAYESDDSNKQQIQTLNQQIYKLVMDDDHQSDLAKIYWTTREWSYDAFDSFYSRLGVSFEKYYPESSVIDLGLKTVEDNTPEVYQESQGAIVFNGEKYGLYTNVFINSMGLPTYAAKDVGLIIKKWQDYKFDRSLVITSNEQADYMRVVLKSVEQFRPDLVKASTHLSHGVVKLAGGIKMSSRLGNFLAANDILDAAANANQERGGTNDDQITIGAVKYAFLKQRIGGDIIYDPAEAVSLEGNSGPYLQYAHARARNIMAKATENIDFDLKSINDFTAEERALVVKLGYYSQVIDQATAEYKPHYICGYLYELAQIFNRFYERSRVIGDPRQDLRLSLVKLYADKLAEGLGLLGIAAPSKM